MSKRRSPTRSCLVEVRRLRGKRKGAVLKEEVWLEDGEVVSYNLAYIDLKVCRVDNGRVLGFDNSHGYHHRHFMGKVEAIGFATYSAVLERFVMELHEIWRLEDAEDQS